MNRRRFSVGMALCALLSAWPLLARAASISVATWASAPAEVRAFENAASAFTRKTGITVKKQLIADSYMDVLKSRFAADNPPDVFYLNSDQAPLLIKSGVLEAFDEKLIRADDFYPQFLDAFRGPDRKVYGLPKDYSTLALYLNPRMLEKAGFRLADVPGDFNGLMKFAARLQARLPKGTAAMLIEKDLARHLSALEAFGGNLIDANGNVRLSGNPQMFDYLHQLVVGHAGQYLLSAKEDLGADWAGSAFGTQKAAMMMEGNWVVQALRKDYPDVPFAAREMPTVNGRHHTMAFVVGYAVARGARNKAGGIAFARFMTDEGMRQWALESGTLPTRKSVEATMSAKERPEMAVHVLGARYATVWSRGESLPIIDTNFGNQFLAALNGTKPLASALANAEKTANREIERQR